MEETERPEAEGRDPHVSSVEIWPGLTTERLRQKLILSSLMIVFGEVMQSSLNDGVRGYFDHLSDEEFNRELAKQGSGPRSLRSARWLAGQGALDGVDLFAIEKVVRHRNELAHDIAQLLIDDQRDVELELLAEAKRIVTKVDRWWIINVDLAILGRRTSELPEYEDIFPSRAIMLDIIVRTLIPGVDELPDPPSA